MIVCLDTNVLLQIFGRNQPFYPIFHALWSGRIALAVSNEIWFEYQEIVTRSSGVARWHKVAGLLDLLSQLHGNILRIEPQFRFNVISTDVDDNKFCDCAIAAEANFIVTEDNHFEILRTAGYKPKPITPEDFIRQFLPP